MQFIWFLFYQFGEAAMVFGLARALWSNWIGRAARTSHHGARRAPVRQRGRLLFQELEDRRLMVIDPIGGPGNVLPESSYPAVVLIHSQDDFTGESTIGTGVLIRPDWVLTAAHVVSGFARETMTIGGKDYVAVENWAANQYFGPDHEFYDIALLKLDRPVDNVEPIPMYNSAVTAGTTLLLVGYGQTGTGFTGGQKGTSPGKRAGYVRIDEIKATTMINRFERGESYGFSGDSGAPLIITAATNVGGSIQQRHYVAGIQQGAFYSAPNQPPTGRYGEEGNIIRVDQFVEEFYNDIRISNGRGLYGRPVTGRIITSDGISQEEGGLDTRSPTLSGGPGNRVGADATSPAGAIVSFPEFEVTDDFDLEPQVTYSHPSGSLFPVGMTEVLVTATDASGNHSTRTFYVEVAMPPELDGFDAPLSSALAGAASAIAAGDLNGDGVEDLALLHGSPQGRRLRTYLGRKDGTFQEGINEVIGGTSPFAAASIVVEDFDHDNHADLAIAQEDPAVIEIWRGDGTGQFSRSSLWANGAITPLLRSADINGDGHPDLLAAGGLLDDEGLTDSLLVYLGSPTGISSLAQPVVTSFPERVIRTFEVADFDRDGTPDLAVAYAINVVDTFQTMGGVALRRGLGNGLFAEAQEHATAAIPYALSVADFQQDHRPDVAVFTAAGLDVFLTQADGSLGAKTTILSLPNQALVAIGDFSVDGQTDFILRNAADGMFTTLRGRGDGTFETGSYQIPDYQPLGPSHFGEPLSYFTVADFDGNGSPDLATATGFNSFAVHINQAEARLLLEAQDVTISQADALFNAVVATFVDPVPGSVAADFAATIWWGDSQSTPGIVTGEDGTFQVLGSHTYYEADLRPLAVEVRKINGPSASGVSTAVVLNVAPSWLAPGVESSATKIRNGESITIQGAFADVGLLDRHYVLIDWGDPDSDYTDANGNPLTKRTLMHLGVEERSFSALHYYEGLPAGASQTYEIRVMVFDQHSGSAVATTTVLVEDPGPLLLPTLTTRNATLAEGNTGVQSLAVTVHLSQPSDDTVTVDYATADGTALLADGDYQQASGRLTFAPGVTKQVITVFVQGDTKFEPDETFLINLSAAAGATIESSTAMGSILNDDINLAPTIASLHADPATIFRGNNQRLIASGVADADGMVLLVEFFHDSNHNGQLDLGTDTLLGFDIVGEDGWQLQFSTLGFDSGPQTYFTRAHDNDGEPSLPVATSVQTIDFIEEVTYDLTGKVLTITGSDHDDLISVLAPEGEAYFLIRTQQGDMMAAYANVNRIVVNAGRGDDVVDLRGLPNSIHIRLYGQAGDDTLLGDSANLVLYGGPGLDTHNGIIENDTPPLVTGAGTGGGPHVRVLDPRTAQERFGFYAYDPSFRGGVRVALGDINGDGAADIITAPGPGTQPLVRVFDGLTGEQISGIAGSFHAYHPAFTGGVFVASGDVNGDGQADIVTAAGAGGGPHVRVFNGADGLEMFGFFAYSPFFGGGVSIAVADVDGDGRDDIITGAGAGGGPHVRVFSGVDGTELMSMYAYHPLFGGGVTVAAGDVDADGKADVITGAGAGGGPHVRVFSGSHGGELFGFYAYHPLFGGGVQVAASDANGDGYADILTAAGPGGGPHVRVFNGRTQVELSGFYAYHPLFSGGLFLAGAALVTEDAEVPSNSAAVMPLTQHTSVPATLLVNPAEDISLSDDDRELLVMDSRALLDAVDSVFGDEIPSPWVESHPMQWLPQLSVWADNARL